MEIAPEPVKVVGNVPYYITSDILLRLFQYRKYFGILVLMLQREVADRIAVQPGKSEYGLLSATTQLYADVEKLFTLPQGAFSPPPKVQSTVVRLTPGKRLEGLNVPEADFMAFLKLAFGQKRKTLWNNLKERYQADIVRAALEKSEIKPNVRAETLSLEDTAELFRELPRNKSNP
jgi:16S rRNA (adenine1518-N6/adenine1519-N6)-dimethyltransferase